MEAGYYSDVFNILKKYRNEEEAVSFTDYLMSKFPTPRNLALAVMDLDLNLSKQEIKELSYVDKISDYVVVQKDVNDFELKELKEVTKLDKVLTKVRISKDKKDDYLEHFISQLHEDNYGND